MSRPGRTIVSAGLLIAATAFPLAAQVIPVRVVPIAEADQFALFPSSNYGMANVSVALADSLLDPHRNPALASRIRRGVYFGAPTFFAVTNDAGSGQTYPFGGIARLGRMFVGGIYATQQINPARQETQQFFFVDVLSSFTPPGVDASPNRTEMNRYAQGMIGVALTDRVSIGASAQRSDLRAMEGMELLFAGSRHVRQQGDRAELRVGAAAALGDGQVEAVALRTDMGMGYDVGYAEVFWDPATRQQRVRSHSMHTTMAARTDGIQLRYDRPWRDSSTRVGAIVTVNDSREQAPAYHEFLGIPRDRSRTRAYNVGVGVSRRHTERLTLAADAILEPVWRRSRGIVDTNSLALYPAGANQDEGYFKFRNAVLRAGAAHDFVMSGSRNRLRLQAGAQVRRVAYTLEQHDHLNGTFRRSQHGWREWTHTWGANFLFPHFEFGYHLRILSGMGRFGAPSSSFFGPTPTLDLLPGPIANPGTTLMPVRLASHQMFFSVPLR